jgi:WD40 repeat protein
LWTGDKADILVGTENTLNPDYNLDAPPSNSNDMFLGSSGRNLQYSPDGRWLALLTKESINIYDLRDGQKQAGAISLDPTALLLGFRFSPDNQSLVYVTSTYLTCRTAQNGLPA